MLSRIGIGWLAIVMLSADAAAQDRLQEALLAQETKLIDAINKKDKAAIATLLSDEIMSVTSARGVQTSQEIIAALEKLSFSSYTISEAKAISVSPDVAILTYKFSWTDGNAGEHRATESTYATSVWKRRDGQWRSVFYQETPKSK
jgi:hypothetical protein